MVKERKTKQLEGGGKESGEYKKGLWTTEEDNLLLEYVKVHGKGKWNRIPSLTGLKRCGKSCRLRWMNYLSPNVKKGDFSQDEDDLIIRLHRLLGNRWSLIAGRVPGRTDNQVKNYWNTHLSKRLGIKTGKCKSVQTFSHPQHFMDKAVPSSVQPSVKQSEGGGPVDGPRCVEDVNDTSFREITTKEEEGSLMEKQNCQSSLVFSAGDDDLIVNNQSLLDFLREYSVDYIWNK